MHGFKTQFYSWPDCCYLFKFGDKILFGDNDFGILDLLAGLLNVPTVCNEKGSVGVKLGFESMHLKVKDFIQLKKTLPQAKLMGSERIVEKIASVKDAEEVENVKKAGAICGKVLEAVLTLFKPGVSELDISAELSYRAKKHGSSPIRGSSCTSNPRPCPREC